MADNPFTMQLDVSGELATVAIGGVDGEQRDAAFLFRLRGACTRALVDLHKRNGDSGNLLPCNRCGEPSPFQLCTRCEAQADDEQLVVNLLVEGSASSWPRSAATLTLTRAEAKRLLVALGDNPVSIDGRALRSMLNLTIG